MVDVAARVAEEDQVARNQVAAVHRVAVRGEDLLLRGARDLDADLRVGPLGQARAVETGLGRGAAPLVGRPQLALGGGHASERSAPRGRTAPAGHRVDLLRNTVAASAAAARTRLEKAAGLVQAQLVAAAVRPRGVLDVRHPLAVAAGIVNGLAGADALLLDGHGLVQEPLEL